MRTLIFTALLAFGSTLAFSSLLAQTGDGLTPAQENICDPLKAKGVTKGLYGLCVAYCEAEAQSEDVLDNYNRKRKETDPEMPCAAPPTCPCWSAEMLEAAAGSGITPYCSSGEQDEAVYIDLNQFPYSIESFVVNSVQCSYTFDPDLDPQTPEGNIHVEMGLESPAQEVVCRKNIADLCP